MSLKGVVTLVAGGCGIVGSGVVNSLVKEGAKCWVPARSQARFDELLKGVPPQHHSQIRMVKADLNQEEDAANLRENILREDGTLNHVVASIGGWRTDGKLSTVSVANYQKGVAEMTLPHFVCYKTFSELLSKTPKSTYTFISGGSGEAKFFDPNASLLPVSASHVYGLYTSAISEYRTNKNLAINELRLFFWIRRKPDAEFDPKKSLMEVGHDYVGKFVPKIILKHKSDIYKVQTRVVGDQLYQKL